MSDVEESKYDIQVGLKNNFIRFSVSKQNAGKISNNHWLRRIEGGTLSLADMILRRENQKINNKTAQEHTYRKEI
jgi:hypothetical protein